MKSLRLEELVKEVRVGVEAFGVAVFITAATPVGKFVCLVASLSIFNTSRLLFLYHAPLYRLATCIEGVIVPLFLQPLGNESGDFGNGLSDSEGL